MNNHKKYAEDIYADEAYVESRKRSLSRHRLKVYYGVGRTGGMRKRRSIEIYFGNEPMTDRMERVLKGAVSVVAYTRYQTEDEKESAYYANRVWTAYSFYIDEKPYNGSLNAVLAQVEQGDSLSVSKREKRQAVEALRKAWAHQYPTYKEPKTAQLTLFD